MITSLNLAWGLTAHTLPAPAKTTFVAGHTNLNHWHCWSQPAAPTRH